MVIHLAFDLISSFFVVISCLMIKFFDIYFLDPLCCFLISIVIIGTTIPLIKNLYKNLMNGKNYDFKLLFGDEVTLGKFFGLRWTLTIKTITTKTLLILLPQTISVNEEKKKEFQSKYHIDEISFILN